MIETSFKVVTAKAVARAGQRAQTDVPVDSGIKDRRQDVQLLVERLCKKIFVTVKIWKPRPEQEFQRRRDQQQQALLGMKS